MIRFACPRCKSVLEAPDRKTGIKIACLKCGQRLQIPQPPTPPRKNKTVLGSLLPSVSDTPARMAPKASSVSRETGEMKRKSSPPPIAHAGKERKRSRRKWLLLSVVATFSFGCPVGVLALIVVWWSSLPVSFSPTTPDSRLAKAAETKHGKDAEVEEQVRAREHDRPKPAEETKSIKQTDRTEERKQTSETEERQPSKENNSPNLFSGAEGEARSVLYPVDGQVDVPLAFTGNEEPNPLPDAKSGLGGYPITAQFSYGMSVTDVAGELTDSTGKKIPVWLSSPEKPANTSFASYQRNAICLIAKEFLEPATRYTVTVSARVNGVAWSRKWRFQTEKGVVIEKLVQDSVDRINHYRRITGLPPVTMQVKWSKECEAHARYLAINFDNSRSAPPNTIDEDPSLPGYSIEGREAAKRSIVSLGMPPLTAIDWYLAGYMNRCVVLDPRLKAIGFGAARSQRQGWVMVLDYRRGLDGPPITSPVLFPSDGQVDVPLSYPSRSSVRPAPPGSNPGYAISVIMPVLPVGEINARLTDSSGEAVDVWVSSPANPAIKKWQQNSICLVPKKPLQPKTTYTVSVKALIRFDEWSRTWNFTTASMPAESSKEAVLASVLQQLNDYRKNAGLKPVEMDAALSKACQLHAKYLVKNAEHPAVRGLGGHDEDPQLPGYTQEGHKAGKTSVIAVLPHPQESVSTWMATLYHRLPLLEPEMQRIGFGYCLLPNQTWRCVMAVTSGKNSSH